MAEEPIPQTLLVIGGSSLVGHRLREIAENFPGAVQFTGRSRLSPGDLVLDARAPERFSTNEKITAVIVCAPIRLVSDALLRRLYDLGMRRLVVFSSTSILTKVQTTDAAERDMLAQLQNSEALVKRFCEHASVRWTILRPTMIYDEGRDQNVTQIMRLIQRSGFFPIAGAGAGLRRPVHAADLAAAALIAVQTAACNGKTYNLSGGEELTYRKMVDRIFAGMGRSPFVVSLPLFVWRIGFWLKSLVQPGGGTNFEMARRMNKDMNFDHDAASADFGYSPRAFQPHFKDFRPPSGL